MTFQDLCSSDTRRYTTDLKPRGLEVVHFSFGCASAAASRIAEVVSLLVVQHFEYENHFSAYNQSSTPLVQRSAIALLEQWIAEDGDVESPTFREEQREMDEAPFRIG